jgi:hypothetical protein
MKQALKLPYFPVALKLREFQGAHLAVQIHTQGSERNMHTLIIHGEYL